MRKELCYLVAAVFLTFFAIGCAAPQVTVMSQTGEPVPEPHYVMMISGTAMKVTFYYSAVGEIKDLDGSLQPNPIYLDKNISHDISSTKYRELMLNVKVFNPKCSKYSIYSNSVINYKIGGNMSYRYKVSDSNLLFRTYQLPFPMDKGINTVKVNFEIQSSDGATLMRTGNFNYVIN